MKLWDKNEPIDQLFERFTIGKDKILDLELAYYDVLGSIGHVKMLAKIDLLKADEASTLLDALQEIQVMCSEGSFEIEEGVEDCHSQLELLLTRKLGDIGKKVHAGRSRNDQVLTALKLFAKAKLEEIAHLVRDLFDELQKKSEEYRETLMPGYTHMQIAMPSSFGLWFGAYAESLLDDLIVLKAAHKVADKSPLGSGAGYGSSFPLDRIFSSNELGFSDLNVNVVYAQMTRGKTEKIVANTLAGVASTLAKYAMDVCMYTGQNFEFLTIDKAYTTGSSIMPHKNNPDGFELIRGKCNQLQALPVEMSMITNNLPSGYHRDLQVLKEHYMPAFKMLIECLQITIAMTKHVEVNEGLIGESKYASLFTVEEVNRLVLKGLPFRDAYQVVAKQVKEGSFQSDKAVDHVHLGSIGNLGNKEIKERFLNEWQFFEA